MISQFYFPAKEYFSEAIELAMSSLNDPAPQLSPATASGVFGFVTRDSI
jgi:hypothetical protein